MQWGAVREQACLQVWEQRLHDSHLLGAHTVQPLETSAVCVWEERRVNGISCDLTKPLKGPWALLRVPGPLWKPLAWNKFWFLEGVSKCLSDELINSRLAIWWTIKAWLDSRVLMRSRGWPLASAFSSCDRCPREQQSVLQDPAASEHPEEAKAPSPEGVLRGWFRGAVGRWVFRHRPSSLCEQGDCRVWWP